jgi:L-ascorbate metabolism protein UlaG (beta-lactamase superfamily)
MLGRKFSRRDVIKIGILGIIVLTTTIPLTPIGEELDARIDDELAHEIKKPKLRPTPETWSKGELSIAWLGHASFLINFYGTRILTDPVLSSRIGITSMGSKIGRKRYLAPALECEDIGQIDLLLLSHAHSDHFDYPTLQKLQSTETIAVTAKNTTPLWKGMTFQAVEEMHWNDSKNLAGVNVKAIEGKHRGARLPWNKGMGANSYLLSKNGVNIFFGGDTAYTNKIQQQLTGIPIDLAILGIAAYSPKSFQTQHTTPEQAWQIAEEMQARWVIPMHWGTFELSNEPMEEPIVRFRQAAKEKMGRIALQEVGASFILP